MNALTVSDLHVPMGDQMILRGVNLVVPENGIVCLLGSNGVGKTTLMRTISGVYRKARGKIEFMGSSILNRPSHEIVQGGICQAPEGRHIFPSMTVEENLRIGAMHRPSGEMAENMARVFALFPVLSERIRQKGGSLSGGEQQMLCIGRALMGKPKLLLLDEPSLGLAPMLVKLIFDMIVEIRRGGTAVLLVEQNARAALRISDYAYVMEVGRTVLEGTPAELERDDRVTKAYLGSRVH